MVHPPVVAGDGMKQREEPERRPILWAKGSESKHSLRFSRSVMPASRKAGGTGGCSVSQHAPLVDLHDYGSSAFIREIRGKNPLW